MADVAAAVDDDAVVGRALATLQAPLGGSRPTIALLAQAFEDVAPEGTGGVALLEDLSPGGARLLMEVPVEPGTIVDFEVPGTNFSGKGRVVFNRVLESPMRVRFVVGLGREGRESRLRTWTREWRSLALGPVDTVDQKAIR